MLRETVTIVRNHGVAIYGKVMDSKGKLGQYWVVSDYLGSNGIIYQSYVDAERRMEELIGYNKNHQFN